MTPERTFLKFYLSFKLFFAFVSKLPPEQTQEEELLEQLESFKSYKLIQNSQQTVRELNVTSIYREQAFDAGCKKKILKSKKNVI